MLHEVVFQAIRKMYNSHSHSVAPIRPLKLTAASRVDACLFQPHHASYEASLLAASIKIHAYASFE